MTQPSIKEIQELLLTADQDEFKVLERSLAADTRKGVVAAIARARARIEAHIAETERVKSLFDYERSLADEHHARIIVGLDEVGRGALAGPLAVGAVVFSEIQELPGLNDSKLLTASKREVLAEQIKAKATRYTVAYVEADVIDEIGITQALKQAFSSAVKAIEDQGIHPDIILLDGNPLHFDSREVNVVKGDRRCASIAAASIIAKVARDAHMDNLDSCYPPYGFKVNKGYGTAFHRDAIAASGLSDVHRKSFCSSLIQPTLFTL